MTPPGQIIRPEDPDVRKCRSLPLKFMGIQVFVSGTEREYFVAYEQAERMMETRSAVLNMKDWLFYKPTEEECDIVLIKRVVEVREVLVERVSPKPPISEWKHVEFGSAPRKPPTVDELRREWHEGCQFGRVVGMLIVALTFVVTKILMVTFFR